MLPKLCCGLLHIHSNLRPHCRIWIILWNLSALAASFLNQTLLLCNLSAFFFGGVKEHSGLKRPQRLTKKRERERDLWTIPAKTVAATSDGWCIGELFPLPWQCCHASTSWKKEFLRWWNADVSAFCQAGGTSGQAMWHSCVLFGK